MRQRLSLLIILALSAALASDVHGQRKPPRDPGSGPNPKPGTATPVPRDPVPGGPRNPSPGGPRDPNGNIPRDPNNPHDPNGRRRGRVDQIFPRDSINYQNLLEYQNRATDLTIDDPPPSSREQIIRQMLELVDEKLKSQVTETLKNSVQLDNDALKKPTGPKPDDAAAKGLAALKKLKGIRDPVTPPDRPRTASETEAQGELGDVPLHQLVQIQSLLNDAADQTTQAPRNDVLQQEWSLVYETIQRVSATTQLSNYRQSTGNSRNSIGVQSLKLAHEAFRPAADQQETQFKIQMGTSDFQSAEKVLGPWEVSPNYVLNASSGEHPDSNHTQGANFLFVDESVHFLPAGSLKRFDGRPNGQPVLDRSPSRPTRSNVFAVWQTVGLNNPQGFQTVSAKSGSGSTFPGLPVVGDWDGDGQGDVHGDSAGTSNHYFFSPARRPQHAPSANDSELLVFFLGGIPGTHAKPEKEPIPVESWSWGEAIPGSGAKPATVPSFRMVTSQQSTITNGDAERGHPAFSSRHTAGMGNGTASGRLQWDRNSNPHSSSILSSNFNFKSRSDLESGGSRLGPASYQPRAVSPSQDAGPHWSSSSGGPLPAQTFHVVLETAGTEIPAHTPEWSNPRLVSDAGTRAESKHETIELESWSWGETNDSSSGNPVNVPFFRMASSQQSVIALGDAVRARPGFSVRHSAGNGNGTALDELLGQPILVRVELPNTGFEGALDALERGSLPGIEPTGVEFSNGRFQPPAGGSQPVWLTVGFFEGGSRTPRSGVGGGAANYMMRDGHVSRAEEGQGYVITSIEHFASEPVYYSPIPLQNTIVANNVRSPSVMFNPTQISANKTVPWTKNDAAPDSIWMDLGFPVARSNSKRNGNMALHGRHLPAAGVYDYPGEYAARFDGVDSVPRQPTSALGDSHSFTRDRRSSTFSGRTETVGHNETITIHGNRTEQAVEYPNLKITFSAADSGAQSGLAAARKNGSIARHSHGHSGTYMNVHTLDWPAPSSEGSIIWYQPDFKVALGSAHGSSSSREFFDAHLSENIMPALDASLVTVYARTGSIVSDPLPAERGLRDLQFSTALPVNAAATNGRQVPVRITSMSFSEQQWDPAPDAGRGGANFLFVDGSVPRNGASHKSSKGDTHVLEFTNAQPSILSGFDLQFTDAESAQVNTGQGTDTGSVLILFDDSGHASASDRVMSVLSRQQTDLEFLRTRAATLPALDNSKGSSRDFFEAMITSFDWPAMDGNERQSSVITGEIVSLEPSFRPGSFDVKFEGKNALGHELAHVFQQTASGKGLGSEPGAVEGGAGKDVPPEPFRTMDGIRVPDPIETKKSNTPGVPVPFPNFGSSNSTSLNGDPDQPIVTGRSYNAQPYGSSAAGRTTYRNITLKRGYTADHNIWSWRKTQESPFDILTNQFGSGNAGANTTPPAGAVFTGTNHNNL